MRPLMQMAHLARQWLLVIVGGLATDLAAAQVVVVVSAKSPVSALSTEQVANIFLGKNMRYPTGAEAVPLDQHEDAAIRKEFYAKVTRRSPALLKAHWSKLLFTGKGQPPREVANGDAVKKLVAEHPKFIGYIDKNAVDDSVRVILVPE